MTNKIDGESKVTDIFEAKSPGEKKEDLAEWSEILQRLEVYIHTLEEKIAEVNKEIDDLDKDTDLVGDAKESIKEDLLVEKKRMLKMLDDFQFRFRELFNYLANLQASVQRSEEKK